MRDAYHGRRLKGKWLATARGGGGMRMIEPAAPQDRKNNRRREPCQRGTAPELRPGLLEQPPDACVQLSRWRREPNASSEKGFEPIQIGLHIRFLGIGF